MSSGLIFWGSRYFWLTRSGWKRWHWLRHYPGCRQKASFFPQNKQMGWRHFWFRNWYVLNAPLQSPTLKRSVGAKASICPSTRASLNASRRASITKAMAFCDTWTWPWTAASNVTATATLRSCPQTGPLPTVTKFVNSWDTQNHPRTVPELSWAKILKLMLIIDEPSLLSMKALTEVRGGVSFPF